MSDTSARVTAKVQKQYEVTKSKLDLLVKFHKEWDKHWEKWLLETKKNNPLYLQKSGHIALRKLVLENVSCEVARKIVPECSEICYNELLEPILRERLENRCVKYKDCTYFSGNSQTDEYIKFVIEQPDFDLMMIDEDVYEYSKIKIHTNLNLECSLGENNHLIQFMLKTTSGLFIERVYFKGERDFPGEHRDVPR